MLPSHPIVQSWNIALSCLATLKEFLESGLNICTLISSIKDCIVSWVKVFGTIWQFVRMRKVIKIKKVIFFIGFVVICKDIIKLNTSGSICTAKACFKVHANQKSLPFWILFLIFIKLTLILDIFCHILIHSDGNSNFGKTIGEIKEVYVIADNKLDKENTILTDLNLILVIFQRFDIFLFQQN